MAKKKVLQVMLKDAVSAEAVKMEEKIHRALRHPSVCRLYDYFHDATRHYLVMLLAVKGSLDALIEDSDQPLTEEVSKK